MTESRRAGADIGIEERGRNDRHDLLPILRESFRGMYFWHARRISPAARRRGIAGLLLDRCVAHLGAQGARSILASVTRGNRPSERLIASRGFRPCRFGDLARHFGAAALRIWLGMTVAPGERVSMMVHSGQRPPAATPPAARD